MDKKSPKRNKKVSDATVVASSESDNFLSLPNLDAASFSSDASFTYMCSNNTIFGTQFKVFPKTHSPLVADMSSDILSRKIDINDFGVIFAGAQKNIGPSGVTIVIIRDDLLERCKDSEHSMLRYKTHHDNSSLYNTPPTFGIYMAGLTFKWIEDQGGLDVIEHKNELKAKILYDAIESNDMFYCPIKESDRSAMNVVFRIQGNQTELEETFVKEAREAGLIELKGHRSVGGLRASIYNAQAHENILALVEFMDTFSQKHA